MERILQGLQAIQHEQAALRLDEPGEARGLVVRALGVGIAEVLQRALEEGAHAACRVVASSLRVPWSS